MRSIRAFRRLRPYFKRYRRAFGVGAVWIVFTAGLGQVIPRLLGSAVDALREPNRFHLLGPFCLGLVAVALVQGVFRFLMRRDIIGASRHIEYDLRRDLYAHLLRLSPSYYDKSRTGDLMTRASSDLEAVRSVVGPATMYFSNTLLIVSSSLVLMLLIDVKLTLFALLPMTMLSVVVRVLGRQVHARTLDAQAQESRMAARLQESLSGIRVVQSYVQEEHELGAFRLEADELLQRNMRLVRVWGMFFPSMALIVGTGAILTLWIGGQQVVRNVISLGDFVAFNAYLTRLTWPMISIGWVLNLLERGAASMSRINQVLETVPAIADPEEPVAPGEMRGEIDFCGVTFSYGDHPPVLENIDLHIRNGETVALVGPTGAGKTTLLNLIARLYDVQEGSVKIDQHDVRRVPLQWLRSGIGVVPQETFLFGDTLSANIEFGAPWNGSRPNHSQTSPASATGEVDRALAADLQQSFTSRADIEHAAEVAQLTAAIQEFPNGFETVLGERGITLSGGQKQRTAIARAILRDPRILLLDDCLSSVDTHTEEEILKGLRVIMQQRTSVIVAHRISTVRSADRVIVIENGRIVQQGTHHELLQQQGYYVELVQKQMLREELERDSL